MRTGADFKCGTLRCLRGAQARGWYGGGGTSSPSCVSSCPNILASSVAGRDRKSQRGLQSTKQIRLAYLSTPPPAAPLRLVGGHRRLPSDKSVGADQPRRRSRRGCEEAEEEISPSHGQIMNKFNSGPKKERESDPAVPGTFHIAVFVCAAIIVRMKVTHITFSFPSSLCWLAAVPLYLPELKNCCNNPVFYCYKANVLAAAELCQYFLPQS